MSGHQYAAAGVLSCRSPRSASWTDAFKRDVGEYRAVDQQLDLTETGQQQISQSRYGRLSRALTSNFRELESRAQGGPAKSVGWTPGEFWNQLQAAFSCLRPGAQILTDAIDHDRRHCDANSGYSSQAY